MNTIASLDKKKCTGCRACEKVCPIKAICMIGNAEGFLEPQIDVEKCINCGLCERTCPQINSIVNRRMAKTSVYAAKNKNLETQKSSSSGGIFSCLANYILDNNGIIYGSAYNEEFKVEHIRVETKGKLYKLRGSKYVQSDTKNSYQNVKEDLENNFLVLYSGTPCQIAGLYSYLGKEYNNLFTTDLVCHGVPSPKLFSKYIKYLENRYKSKVIYYDFRNKEKNIWGDGLKIVFNNGKIKYSVARLDSYNQAFYNAYDYRECCYNCKYANEKRIGDITLGDFWGIKNTHPDFYDDKGVSIIIVNTLKGKELFEQTKSSMEYIESNIENASKNNKNLVEPAKRSNHRDKIYTNIDKISYKKYEKYNLHFKKKTVDVLKNLIPFKLKNQIKKYIIK